MASGEIRQWRGFSGIEGFGHWAWTGQRKVETVRRALESEEVVAGVVETCYFLMLVDLLN